MAYDVDKLEIKLTAYKKTMTAIVNEHNPNADPEETITAQARDTIEELRLVVILLEACLESHQKCWDLAHRNS